MWNCSARTWRVHRGSPRRKRWLGEACWWIESQSYAIAENIFTFFVILCYSSSCSYCFMFFILVLVLTFWSYIHYFYNQNKSYTVLLPSDSLHELMLCVTGTNWKPVASTASCAIKVWDTGSCKVPLEEIVGAQNFIFVHKSLKGPKWGISSPRFFFIFGRKFSSQNKIFHQAKI